MSRSIMNAGTTFNWNNFEEFASVLIGAEATPAWSINGAFGRAVSYDFDDETGRGRVELFDLARGIKVAIFDCMWRQGKTYKVYDGELMRFNFSLDIDIAMQLAGSQRITVSSPSWRIINNHDQEVITETIPSGKKATWVTVCCTPDFVERIIGKPLDDLPDFISGALMPQTQGSYYEYYDFTARINSITADLLRTTLSGALRVLFIEARCTELLCLALDHLMHPIGDSDSVRLTDEDREAIRCARDFLVKEHADPPKIATLSRRLGVNRNKLFYGFKALYGVTIAEFIQDQRLQESKRLLRHTNLPISEIAHRVGFSHQSNFATAFKKHFGVTPRQSRE